MPRAKILFNSQAHCEDKPNFSQLPPSSEVACCLGAIKNRECRYCLKGSELAAAYAENPSPLDDNNNVLVAI